MKIAMLFPGYSSQYVGIGKEFYDEYRIVQEYFEEASNCLNVNFVKLCFASSDAELSKIHNAYTVLFLVTTAIADLLAQEGIRPDVVVGYAQGEYAALSACGGISFPDGLYLLAKYSAAYEEFLKDNDIVALRIQGVSSILLQDLCEKVSEKNKIFIAISHSSSDHIIAGFRKNVDELKINLAMQNVLSFHYIGVGIGPHSLLMNGVAAYIKMYLEKVDFKNFNIPLISSLDGKKINSGLEMKKIVLNSIHNPLSYVSAVAALEEYDLVLEVGNSTPLHKIIKTDYPHKTVMEIKKYSDITLLRKILKM